MQTAVSLPLYRTTGFTLADLIIALAIVMILLSLGVPSFRTLSAKNQQTSEINNFVHHIYLARSLAISSERHQMLCPSSDGETCLDNSDWSQGFMIFEDTNKNKTRDEDERLQAYHRPTTSTKIDIHSSVGRKRVVFHGDGRPSGYNLTLTFCDPHDLAPPKAVIVNNVGRTRVSETRSDGSPLRCDR
ncbi:MAG: GspH/FimT family pseudopilin [Candidatus Thiodiazotropha sp. (ex Dulcina madagascariensis)]|nr:GspH/FimT family pseudopilin [Candidatus Thiodiazotropha sp. (ex Dulcina madagascariensis)]